MTDDRVGHGATPPASPSTGELAIIGNETADHTVRADVLVRALDHLQRIVYLVAAADERRPIGERFAVPESFKERYGLRCGVPKGSSFAVPLALGPARALWPESPGESPLWRALDLFRSAARGAWGELGRVFADPKYLPRVLSELQAMLPRTGDRWGIALTVGADRVTLDAKAYRTVRDYMAPDVAEDAVMTVTGDLVRVDIESRKVVVRYRPTGGEIQCHCEPSVLESVLESWDVPIQVTGRFTLDRKGHPLRLTGVTRVEPIDLSPMTFDRIEWGGRQLAFDPPLTIQPTLDEESGQLYVLTDDELGIDVFAQTREQVADELAEQVLFQWDTYARESPERLTPGARWLRDALLSRMREVELAAQPEGP